MGGQLRQMQATCALCSIYSSQRFLTSNFLECGISVELNGNHVSSSPQGSCHIPILGDYILGSTDKEKTGAQGQMCLARSLPLHP